MIGTGATALRDALGSGCPKERDVKTSSKVASPSASAHSGFDAPMFLHNNRLFGRAHASRSRASEVQTPPRVQPYNGGSNVNTSKLECGLELVRTGVCPLKSPVLLHSSCTNCAPFRAVVMALCDVIPCTCDVASRPARRVCVARASPAINVQPNGNAPLLEDRRAHRLIDRAENATHRAGRRARRRCRRGNGAPELVRDARDRSPERGDRAPEPGSHRRHRVGSARTRRRTGGPATGGSPGRPRRRSGRRRRPNEGDAPARFVPRTPCTCRRRP
jgi:hypothetical protein